MFVVSLGYGRLLFTQNMPSRYSSGVRGIARNASAGFCPGPTGVAGILFSIHDVSGDVVS